MALFPSAGVLAANSGLQILAGTSSSEGNPANDLTPGYPADGQSGDDLYCHIAVYDETEQQSVVGPTGFVLVARQITGAMQQWIFRRLADGTETGTLSAGWSSGFAGTGTRIGMAQIYRVREHAREDVVGGAAAGSGTVVAATSLTVTGPSRIGLLFGAIRVPGPTAPSVAEVTGESGGDWQQRVDEPRTHSNQSGALQLWAANLSTPTTISGGNATSAIGGAWSTLAIAAGAETDISQPPEIFDKEYDVDAAPYNAAGNGTTDDQAAIQSMFDDIESYSQANPSHTIGVHFGAGKTYRVETKLSLSNIHNVTFLGDQANPPTIARHQDFDVSGSGSSQMWETVEPDQVEIRDMVFDGRRDIIPRDGAFGHLIVVRGGDGFITRRCTYKRSQAVGLKIGPTLGTQQPIQVDEIPTNYLIDTCLFTGNAKQGVTSDYCHGALYIRCIFEETGARFGDSGQDPSAGIDLEPQSNHGIDPAVAPAANDNITFRQCVFQNNDGTGLQLGGNDGLNRNIQVDACTFINNGLDSPTPIRGALWIRNCSPTPQHNILVHDCIFRDQITPPIANDSKAVIYIHDFGDPSVLIEENWFHDNTGAAVIVAMRRFIGTGLVTIRDNDIDVSSGLQTGTSSAESNGPAALAVQWSNVSVTGNTLTGDATVDGLVVESTGGNEPVGVDIQNNLLKDFNRGLWLRAGTGHTTSPNTFDNCAQNIVDDT